MPGQEANAAPVPGEEVAEEEEEEAESRDMGAEPA